MRNSEYTLPPADDSRGCTSLYTEVHGDFDKKAELVTPFYMFRTVKQGFPKAMQINSV
jgi:hypothetical protein